MFDWRDYLDLADYLATNRPDEAAQRSAISRAYYAAYHRASRFVRDQVLIPPRKKLTHDLVWQLIRDGRDPGRQDVGNRGKELKLVRTRADYDNPFPGDLQKSMRDALLASRELIDLIDRL